VLHGGRGGEVIPSARICVSINSGTAVCLSPLSGRPVELSGPSFQGGGGPLDEGCEGGPAMAALLPRRLLSASTDASLVMPHVTPLSSSSPRPPLTSHLLLLSGWGGGGCEYARSTNTFIRGRVMGAGAAAVSRGNDLCRRSAPPKWAKSEPSSP